MMRRVGYGVQMGVLVLFASIIAACLAGCSRSPRQSGESIRVESGSFQGALHSGLRDTDLKHPPAKAIFEELLGYLADPTFKRSLLLGRLRDFIRDNPEYPGAAPRSDPDEVTPSEALEILQKMSDEDEQMARLGGAQMDPIDRLIFQLRNQRGMRRTPSERIQVLVARDTSSPAAQLVGAGRNAVPKLIASIENREFTRAVSGLVVLRIGDAALEILSRIARRRFEREARLASSGGDWRATAVRFAKAWWQDIQTKGERQTLIETVEKGGISAPFSGFLVYQKYPKDAFSALASGIHATQNNGVRAELLRLLQNLADRRCAAVARENLSQSHDFMIRLRSAELLAIYEPTPGVEALVRLWDEVRTRPSQVEGTNDYGALISDLVASLRPSAIKALAKDLLSGRPWCRNGIVHEYFRVNTDINDWSLKMRATSTKLDQWNYDMESERLLAGELQDDLVQLSDRGVINGVAYVQPRNCDFAAAVLAKMNSFKYHIDLSAAPSTRDQQIRECLMIWRHSQNYARQMAEDRSGSNGAQNPPSSGSSSAVSHQIRPTTHLKGQGASTLSEVQQHLRGLNRSDPRYATWLEAAHQFSNQVVTVRIEGGERPNDPMSDYVRSLKGKPITVDAIQKCLQIAVGNWPKSRHSLTIQAQRQVAGQAIDLSVGVNTLPLHSGSTPWGFMGSIEVDLKPLYDQNGVINPVLFNRPDLMRPLREALGKALAADSSPHLSITLTLTHDTGH